MAYLLVDQKRLQEKGVKNYQVTKDGRGVIYEPDAKFLGDLGDVERIDTAAEVLKLLNK